MHIMIHVKFHFNWLMLTLIFGISTEKSGPDRVKLFINTSETYNKSFKVLYTNSAV